MPPDSDSFDLRRPQDWAAGIIVCSPHSGRDFPDWFVAESSLDLAALRSSEDAFVDDLIQPALAAGAITLSARIPRCIVDLNRAPSELDPAAVRDAPRRPSSARAVAGLGVIPRVVSGGRAIHPAPIAMAEAKRRIETFWQPYHKALRQVIAESLDRFGWAVVLDVHSMPHDAVSNMIPPIPDVVIGDRHGTSCEAALRERVSALFRHEGFSLRLNTPFSGAYIATSYGRPSQNVHVLQIEIDRALYLDSATLSPSDGYADVAARLGRIFQAAALIRPSARRPRVAVG